ncbi:hypothetical protein OSB04_015269 [Centaurea solstitialis]|uniref:Uncharacterized protein n=1 Tax=Centaurea solstitialis TaxID=347529 RepID=A0AA38WIK4_9ASTR|nr:hypothetical protein OSB04_015269 [Centaurea solstitialis]
MKRRKKDSLIPVLILTQTVERKPDWKHDVVFSLKHFVEHLDGKQQQQQRRTSDLLERINLFFSGRLRRRRQFSDWQRFWKLPERRIPRRIDGGDEDSGFSRSEFRQSLLVGTVKYYERHVFLCYKKPQVGRRGLKLLSSIGLPRLLSAALTSRKSDMKRQTRLTICEGHDGTETSNGDVLIFPDMIRYRRLTHFDVDTFVEEVLVKDGEWLPGSPEALRGSYIFVCAHGARDKRCGVCGPALVSRFKDEIELRGHQSKVSVRPCSHIGGHKYAGNVIIFGSNNHGKVTGHWYGYVMPDDVPTLLEQHIEKGEIVDWLWRGQMGLSEEDQKKAQEQRVIANGGGDMDRSLIDSAVLTDEIYSHPDGTQVEDDGCCQANGSSTCCRSPKLPENPAISILIRKRRERVARIRSLSTSVKEW